MKQTIFYILIIFRFSLFSQLIQLNSGTTVALKHLSIIQNDIIICGATENYLSRSVDECATSTIMTGPGIPGNYYYMQRLNTNTAFLLSYVNGATLYKTTDGCATWNKRMDTSNFWPMCFAFFDGFEGITDKGMFGTLLRTKDAGASWSATPAPMDAIDVMKTYDDSTVVIGGIAFPNPNGILFLSKDRGNNWLPAWTMPTQPTDFFFLNHDTILSICAINQIGMGSSFIKTTNGGQTWSNSSLPLRYPWGINFKNKYEGYVVGENAYGKGIILKTTDFGVNWQQFNTNITTQLLNIAFLNDSIALLTGSNGVLLKWNYKQSIFTGIGENVIENAGVSVYPNPIIDDLHFKSNQSLIKVNIRIVNTLGQNIYTNNDFDLQTKINLNFLNSGLYFLILSIGNDEKTFKIIKN